MKYTLENVKLVIESKGGKLLSPEVKTCDSRIRIMCEKGHIWEVAAISIASSWCRKCNTERQKKTIMDMHNYAKIRGGECLSTKYINAHSKLLWKCQNGHEWYALPRGRWCPYCTRYINEEKCRYIFETLTGKKFPKTKIENLELDGYCKELNLAFEYNGKQHYQKHKLWHRGRCSFERQLQNDYKKMNICSEKNIKLIIIPYNSYKTDEELALKIASYFNISDPKINVIEFYKQNMSIIKELQKIAEERGGKLLSDIYINSQTKVKWQCKYGHEWSAASSHIKYGHWCPSCGGTEKLTLEHAINLAKKKNGKCLSTEYINTSVKMLWLCNLGHEFEESYRSVKSGKWCPVCCSHFITIEKLKQVAKSYGGECLSKTYSVGQKLKWKCSKGHMWESSCCCIRKSSGSKKIWCPICSHCIKLELVVAQKIAKERNGECLSEEYKNIHSKLLWKCKNNHIFKKSLSDVKCETNFKRKNNWCSVCYKYEKKRRQNENSTKT